MLTGREGATSISSQINDGTKQEMARRQVFAFEGSHRRIGNKGFADGRSLRHSLYCETKFLQVDWPVAATLEDTAQTQQRWKNRMAMPASAQVSNLRPRIRVK